MKILNILIYNFLDKIYVNSIFGIYFKNVC